MHVIDGAVARRNLQTNKYGIWNRGTDSSVRSEAPSDASPRIFDGMANVRARYSGKRLEPADPVFAMGSCFARGVEDQLVRTGARVVSRDERTLRPEFAGPDGRDGSGFFHRYTPESMLQEFRAAFGEQPGWSDQALLFEPRRPGLLSKRDGRVHDLNYAPPTSNDLSLAATLTRRRIAHDLVRAAATARVVILTLGLTESWFHRPSGLYLNWLHPEVLARSADEFELRTSHAAEVEACLEEIFALLRRVKQRDDFDMVVTVSPVPMRATFTAQDVIVANMESKSVLRAAAGAFCGRRKSTHYFPSYEMALYSQPNLVWRPDRVHVEKAMTRHIVRQFVRAYYREGAFAEA